MAILPKTHTLPIAMLCTALASHAHALILTQRPTCFPLGGTTFILENTNNARATHNALRFTLPCILNDYLTISFMVINNILSTFLKMPC